MHIQGIRLKNMKEESFFSSTKSFMNGKLLSVNRTGKAQDNEGFKLSSWLIQVLII